MIRNAWRMLASDCPTSELILWLATNSADLGFVKREAAKLTNLVEAQTADRPIPLVSFVARQRDLRELVGDHVPGAEKLSFSAIPDSLINAAEYWRDFRPDEEPIEVAHDAAAMMIFDDARRRSEDEYDRCQAVSDNAGCAIWARVVEQAHKLAILHACSADRITPEVDRGAAEWATGFTMQHAEWLLTRIGERAGEESKFEQIANRIMLRLRNKGGRILRSEALKASKVDKIEYERIINTLELRNEVRKESEGKSTYLCLVA